MYVGINLMLSAKALILHKKSRIFIWVKTDILETTFYILKSLMVYNMSNNKHKQYFMAIPS